MDDAKAAKRAAKEQARIELLASIERGRVARENRKKLEAGVKDLPAAERKEALKKIREDFNQSRLEEMKTSDPKFAARQAKNEESFSKLEEKIAKREEQISKLNEKAEAAAAEAEAQTKARVEERKLLQQQVKDEIAKRQAERASRREELELARNAKRTLEAERKAIAKENLRIAAEADQKRRQAESEAKRAELLERLHPSEESISNLQKMTGKQVLSARFGYTLITIYEHGFIRIGNGFDSKPEKLVSIQGQADITKKTGVGRAVAGLGLIAIGQLPLNMHIPNRRGDLTLTIVTDTQTRVLHVGTPTDTALESLRKLDAVGNAILSGRKSANNISSAITKSDLSSELVRLNELHQSGILTQQEFIAAKAKLLGL